MVISKWIYYKKAAGLAASALLLSLSLLPNMPAEAREGLHQSYELQKVVIFSRHNLRSPMATDSEKGSPSPLTAGRIIKALREICPTGAVWWKP